MDATRNGNGGGRALHALEFVENPVLSTSWLKRRPFPARTKCSEISQCTFPETAPTDVWREKQLSLCSDFEMAGMGHFQDAYPREPLKKGSQVFGRSKLG